MGKVPSALWAAALAVALSLGGCRCGTSVQDTQGNARFLPTGMRQSAGDEGRTLRVDFGDVPIEEAITVSESVRVRNQGSATVTIQAPVPDASSGDAFSLPDAGVFPLRLGPGQTSDLSVRFLPRADSAQAAGFTLPSDDGQVPPLHVSLAGRGVAARCTLLPGVRLDFGNVLAGSTEARALSFENTGDEDWGVTGVTLFGSEADSFALDGPSSFDVPAASKVDVPIRFSPTHAGDFTAFVQFQSTAGCAPQPYPVHGVGVQAVLVATPNPVEFGFVDIGVPWGPAVQRLHLQNIGNNAVTLSGGALCGLGSGCTEVTEFATRADGQSTTLGDVTIAPGTTVEVPLYFRPAALHEASARLVWSANAAAPGLEVGLHGTGGGPRIDVEPTSLDFPLAAVGVPQTQQLVVTNVGSSLPAVPESHLHVTQLEVVPGPGTAPTEFAADFVPPASVPLDLLADESRPVEVTFSPATDGAHSATLRIHSDDVVMPVAEVSLTGFGKTYTSCQYAIVPYALDFGALAFDTQGTFSILNLGTGPQDACLVSNLGLDSASSGVFSLPGGGVLSEEVAPGGELPVQVAVTLPGPSQAVANFSGAVTFNISAPVSSARVPLSAQEGCVSVLPTPLDFGPVQTGCQSTPQVVSVLNGCQAEVVLAGTHLASAGGVDAGASGCPGGAACPAFFLDGGIDGGSLPDGGYSGGVPVAASPEDVSLVFVPQFVGDDTGALVVTVAQAGQLLEFQVPLQGEGVGTAQRTEHFVQTSPKVDVLLNRVRASGDGEDPDGGNTIWQFTRTLVAAQDAGVDFRVAAIYTDYAPPMYSNPIFGTFTPDDAGIPVVLTSTTPDVEEGIRAIWSFPGSPGASENMPYEGFVRAFSPPLSATFPASSFLRSDASLAFIVMSDEQELSGAGFAPIPWTLIPTSYYFTVLSNLKGPNHLDLLTVNVASYLTDGSCLLGGITSPTVDRYTDMISWTGGSGTELCNPDWADNFEPLRAALFSPRSRFQLAGVPAPGSVGVSVNGAPVSSLAPDGGTVWTYESLQNWVRFELTEAPPPGSAIDISYQLECQ